MKKTKLSHKFQIPNPKSQGWNFFLFYFNLGLGVWGLGLFSSFFLTSCDKVDQPFEQQSVIEVPLGIKFDTVYSSPNGNKRYILLEEFTGHTCPNCPDGAREAERLDSIHGKQLILVSIHAGYFAKPHTPQQDTMYLADYRTGVPLLPTLPPTEGEEYNASFAVASYPAGMVSRTIVAGNMVLDKGTWGTALNAIVNDQPKAKIDIMNLYNDSLRLLKIKVSTQFLLSAAGANKLQIYLIQDHIIDWQVDGFTDVPNYDHRHMLRKVLNGTWGTQILSSNANDTASFEFSFNINQQWNVANCSVIAFIYNSSVSPSGEIIQVNEAEVKK